MSYNQEFIEELNWVKNNLQGSVVYPEANTEVYYDDFGAPILNIKNLIDGSVRFEFLRNSKTFTIENSRGINNVDRTEYKPATA